MKKIIFMIILMLALTACGKEAVNEQTPTDNTPEPSKTVPTTKDTTPSETFDEDRGIEKNGCYDSDGGSFDKIKGYVKDESGETYKDVCANQFSVREYYCGEFGFKKDKILNCKFACEDGVCIEGTVETECVDSDFRDEFTKGTVTYKGEIKTDYCDTDRTLAEQICNNVDIAAEDDIVCENGCSNGKCNAVVEVDQSSTCTDYDMGPDAEYEASKVKDPRGEHFDVCLNVNSVKEFYCNSYGYKADKNVNCVNGCEAGACIR